MNSPDKNQALHLVEEMQKIGYPNTDNIESLKEKVREMGMMSASVDPAARQVIKRLNKVLHKIEEKLKEEGEIPSSTYMTFNKVLVLLKAALRGTI